MERSNQEAEGHHNQNKHYIREALQEGNLMSAMGLRRIIEVLHNKELQSIYYANSEAGSILENWSATHGWARAARIFGSHEVIHNRPDGTYLIPVFIGPTSYGHWVTVIIEKHGRYRKGHILDSLGTTTADNQIIQKIAILFGGQNTYFSWNIIPTRLQSELECGPRTALAIFTVATSIATGISVEDSIASASLVSIRQEDYDSNIVRDTIANLAGQYESRMWTHPVRTIAPETRPRPTEIVGYKRKKRRKGKSGNPKKNGSTIVLSH